MATEIIRRLKLKNRILKIAIVMLCILLILLSVHTVNVKREYCAEDDEYG